MSELTPGASAPAFSLTAQDGQRYSLKDFKGKKIVLYFYPKDDTSVCTKEACAFQNELAAIKKKGSVVLGVSPDPVTSHQKFSKKYDLTFPVLSDESKEILQSYGVWQEKSMYGRKYMGVVRTTYIIDEKGKITHVFPKVRVKGHVKAVLEALGE